MRLYGEVSLPGDKSISHRAIILSSIGYGKARITNFLISQDTLATVEIMKILGTRIEFIHEDVLVYGRGFNGLKKTEESLNCFNSGTTVRLLMGALSGLSFQTKLIGDKSLSKRPMKRVSKHLEKLGVNILLKDKNYLPANIVPSKVHGNEIYLDVASAQVKSAVILSALHCCESTKIHEINQTRNHTELMLSYFGADIKCNQLEIEVSGNNRLIAKDIDVPGDISSAAFFIVATLITPDSEVLIKNCGLNETRMGIIQVLDLIDADYMIINKKTISNEKRGDLIIKYTKNLKPMELSGTLIPLLIDEIPILALLATQIEGTSIIKDAHELRVKETDRIKACASELNKLGANVLETDDGLIIQGKTVLKKARVNTYFDHRMSMMFKVARLICEGLQIDYPCDAISYPKFENDLSKLMK